MNGSTKDILKNKVEKLFSEVSWFNEKLIKIYESLTSIEEVKELQKKIQRDMEKIKREIDYINITDDDLEKFYKKAEGMKKEIKEMLELLKGDK